MAFAAALKRKRALPRPHARHSQGGGRSRRISSTSRWSSPLSSTRLTRAPPRTASGSSSPARASATGSSGIARLDERSDPVKSTRAAAAYFRDLYEMFGDWHLAMAAYDAGEGQILKSLQRTGARDFWELAAGSSLRRETRDYVPFVLATALIAKDPARFGFDVVPDPPLAWDTVTVTKPVDLARVAELTQATLPDLQLLNSELRTRTTPHGVAGVRRARSRRLGRSSRVADRRASGRARGRREARRRQEGRDAPEDRAPRGRVGRRAVRLERPAAHGPPEEGHRSRRAGQARSRHATRRCSRRHPPAPRARSAAFRRPRPPSRRRPHVGPFTSVPPTHRSRAEEPAPPPSRSRRKASSTRRRGRSWQGARRPRRRAGPGRPPHRQEGRHALLSRRSLRDDDRRDPAREPPPLSALAPGRPDAHPLARRPELTGETMTVARAYSATVAGLEGRTVVVEAAIGAGLPGLTIVGLPDAAVKESRERIRSALRHVGFPLPSKNVVVNLAPADLPKSGTALDLAVALAILAANGDLPAEALAKATLVGELALDGELRGVPGVLSFAETSRREERALLVPPENAEEAAAVPSLHVFAAPHLGAAIAHLLAREVLPRVVPSAASPPVPGSEPDLADVRGQAVARRALEIAAAGGHNILFSGPPGSGKTMLARRLPGILPPLSREESLDATRIWSVAGRLPAGSGLLTQRPFRSPHHGASAAALAGGGADPRPGELSLAHFGVLFLDELPEFRRDALEALREPLEDGVVSVARVAGARTFPARFLLVGAMNPCPCGFRGDPRRACSCSPRDVARYRRKISGPLLDRIDLHVEVPALASSDLGTDGDGETSAAVRARVEAARARQAARTGDPRLVNAAVARPPRALDPEDDARGPRAPDARRGPSHPFGEGVPARSARCPDNRGPPGGGRDPARARGRGPSLSSRLRPGRYDLAAVLVSKARASGWSSPRESGMVIPGFGRRTLVILRGTEGWVSNSRFRCRVSARHGRPTDRRQRWTCSKC